MPSEFEIIRRLAAGQKVRRTEVIAGIGDDAAVLDVPADHELAVSTDTLNIGVHFPVNTTARDIGFKSLAVNLSDMAAMGAEPLAANLSLSLPDSDPQWLEDFAAGFFPLAEKYGVQLTGGDTTRGALSISITIFGMLPKGQAIRRSTAETGDLIYVTGTLGDAGAALLALRGELALHGSRRHALLGRLNRPAARVEAGRLLRGLATSCIDISDGLAADLGHILRQSGKGANLVVNRLPVSGALQRVFDQVGNWNLPLHAGDDYELCFTIPVAARGELKRRISTLDVPVSRIGRVEARPGLRLTMPDGSIEAVEQRGYEHFI